MKTNSTSQRNQALHVPAYWEEAKSELMKRDRILRRLIPQFGDLYLLGRDDPFTTLTRSIIAQQISSASAAALWDKYLTVFPKSTPTEVLKVGQEGMAKCGVSKRKSDYILDLARHFQDGKVHVDKWTEMSDEEVIAELVQIRGISRWTAEMFLIFNLLRPNILPLDDPGLVSGISKNYFSGEPVSRIDIREVAANWEPWRTVATWYMWRSLDSKA
ncbi:DNA-3-methyladenine glycosylase 2 family protein [Undibacterium cyanobacteriorum]|uniref:DNA-3-methyladenine glycosylase II n=1 Tax=Undibacterium cyanobacteriorum TaxID=3073561 RepID=A0ABY9RNB1_9BURK|nr:DNA-3-methyladenine glycosylase 2 family protein [Undibacterium sp. 20NA77.5]WMW82309.1 DNA-3-methyladenine glycosylase 2 family protein [Undibacterium sp. 20NA77.5]